jgi:mutator protein MutT
MPTPPYVLALRQHVGHGLLMITSALGVLWDEEGRVLLTRRHDDGLWGLPGGVVDPGEEPARCVVRELREELGLDVEPVRLLGITGGPPFRHTFPNGDVTEFTLIFFACRLLGGQPAMLDGEVTDWGYFALDALPPLVAPYPVAVMTRSSLDAPPYFQWDDAWLESAP